MPPEKSFLTIDGELSDPRQSSHCPRLRDLLTLARILLPLRDTPGEQAQVDLAQFEVIFTEETRRTTRIVWLFACVVGFSRLIWAGLSRAAAPKPADGS